MNDFEVTIDTNCRHKSYIAYCKDTKYDSQTYGMYLTDHYPQYIKHGKWHKTLYHYKIIFNSEAHYTWWLLEQ